MQSDKEYTGEEKESIKASEQGKWFLSTLLGKKLIERSESDVYDGLRALADVDPEDSKEIKRLQNQIKVAETALSYIQEVINEGDQVEDLANSIDNQE